MKRIVAAIALLVALGLASTAVAGPLGHGAAPAGRFTATADYCADSEEAAFLKLINDYRAQNGLPPVALSQTLGAASEHHSVDMATANYVGHNLSDGTTFTTNMTNHGYTNSGGAVGENVAGGYATASSVFAAWKASTGHNANMLSPYFAAIGIGRAYNANSTYKWYWTTDFGGYFDVAGAVCPTTTAPTPTATPQPTAAASLAVYVSALSGKATTKRGATTLVIKVEVRNPSGAAVSGAAVSVTLTAPDGTARTLSGSTDSRGQVSWSVKASVGSGTYVAAVSSVTASGPYDPSLNQATSAAITVP